MSRPVIDSAILNGNTPVLFSSRYDLTQVGLQRFPRGYVLVNYLYITGERFGANPTVKLTHDGVTAFHKLLQENSLYGSSIKYWFWVDATQASIRTPGDLRESILTSTLSVVVETVENGDSDSWDANGGVAIVIRHEVPGPS